MLSSLYEYMPGEYFYCQDLIIPSIAKPPSMRKARDIRSIAIALETGGAFHRIISYSTIGQMSMKAKLLSLKAGQVVYQQGDANGPVYLILGGQVQLFSSAQPPPCTSAL